MTAELLASSGRASPSAETLFLHRYMNSWQRTSSIWLGSVSPTRNINHHWPSLRQQARCSITD